MELIKLVFIALLELVYSEDTELKFHSSCLMMAYSSDVAALDVPLCYALFVRKVSL